MDRQGATVLHIAARSLDLNPIENVFNIVDQKLDRIVLEKQMSKETFKQFSKLVRNNILNIHTQEIDIIIDTMPKDELITLVIIFFRSIFHINITCIKDYFWETILYLFLHCSL